MNIKTCMPPDPDTRTPAFRLPPGSCDAHCHVFGPGDVFPYAPTRKYTPPDAPKEKLRELHGILGVERAVIVQASCHGTDNSAMLDAIAHSSRAYRGVCLGEGRLEVDLTGRPSRTQCFIIVPYLSSSIWSSVMYQILCQDLGILHYQETRAMVEKPNDQISSNGDSGSSEEEPGSIRFVPEAAPLKELSQS